MHKKLLMACVAVVALAGFVSPVASASPVLTESGKTLPVGASVTGKNTGVAKFTGGFALECEVVHLQGTVTKNAGTEIGLEVPVGGLVLSNAGGAACASALGATTYKFTSKLCLATIPKTDSLTLTGCGAAITYDMIVGGTTCRYSGATWLATFTTNSNPGTFNISEQSVREEEPRSFFCPDEGKWDLDFDLYTTDGTAVSIS